MTCNVLRLFVNTLTAHNKYSLLRRDNWMQTIHMHLSGKQKILLNFFVHFQNQHQTLNFFKLRWPSWLMYFRNYGRRKTWSDKSLKSSVWDDPSTGNMVNGPKHWFNLNGSFFTIFVDAVKVNDLEKTTLSDMQSIKTFC